ANTKTGIVMPKDLPVGTKLIVKPVDKKPVGYTVAGDVLEFIFIFPEGKGFADVRDTFSLTLGVDGTVKGTPSVYHYNTKEDKWEKIDGKVQDGKISIKVKHFSIYGIFVAESSDAKKPPVAPDTKKNP